MSAFAPQLIRALATGAALETGRAAARRGQGMGFAAGDYWDFDAYNDYGNDWDWWFGGGGGDSYTDYDLPMFDWGGGSDLPFIPMEFDYLPPGGVSAGSPYEGQAEYLYNYIFNPGAIDYGYGDAFAPGDSSGNSGGGFDWAGWFDQLIPWVIPSLDGGPGPANYDPNADGGPQLPRYCPRGTYHPQNDPYACVPFPPNDNAAKKQANQQKKAQQSAANAMKAAQKKQDQACPKHPQGLPVWKNPQTGKCEVVPQCPPGAKFDSTTRRCLTPAQVKELYGDNSWLWWLLIGGGALLVMSRSDGGRRR